MEATPDKVAAGKRLVALFDAAKKSLKSDYAALMFLDKPQPEDGPTPRELALKSYEGLNKAKALIAQQLVSS